MNMNKLQPEIISKVVEEAGYLMTKENVRMDEAVRVIFDKLYQEDEIPGGARDEYINEIVVKLTEKQIENEMIEAEKEARHGAGPGSPDLRTRIINAIIVEANRLREVHGMASAITRLSEACQKALRENHVLGKYETLKYLQGKPMKTKAERDRIIEIKAYYRAAEERIVKAEHEEAEQKRQEAEEARLAEVKRAASEKRREAAHDKKLIQSAERFSQRHRGLADP